MLYSTLRKSIKTGDVFFTSSNTIFSRLIRFFTQSRVSHVGIFFWQGDRLMIFEMLTGGGHIAFASEYIEKMIKENTRVYYGRIPHQGVSDPEILDEIEKLSVSEYDMKGALGSVTGWTDSKNKYFCSEAMAEILGYPRFDKDLDEVSYTPDDLLWRVKNGVVPIE